jgi:hypothetical protein
MDPLVTIRTYSRVIDARLAQVRLQGAGMPAYLLDEAVASIDPFLTNAIGGVKLQVRLTDEAAARELLDRSIDDDAGDEETMDPDEPRCPRCDSEYVFPTGKASHSDAARQLRCKRCHYLGDAEAFAPRPPTGQAPSGRHENERAPAFRLIRSRGLAGGVAGFFAGFIITAIFIAQIGPWGFILGTLIGAIVGRSWKYAVCSDPNCRTRIRPTVSTCEGCKRPIRARVKSEGEHFIRIAEWKRERAKK